MVCRPESAVIYVGVGIVVARVFTVFRQVTITTHQVVEDSSVDIHSIIKSIIMGIIVSILLFWHLRLCESRVGTYLVPALLSGFPLFL